MKVLIFYDKNNLKPVGGPSGYLYNVYKELQIENIDFIDFIDSKEIKTSKKDKLFNKLRDFYNKKVPRSIKMKLGLYEKYVFKNIFGKIPRTTNVNIDDYDIIHFHSTLTLYMVKDSLKNYKGKILLTSHSPKILHKEIIDEMVSSKKYEKNKEKYNRLEIIDEYSFNRADYIIFPTKEAEECYYNTWDKYDKIHKKNKDKYIYLESCINPVKIHESKKNVREKYNIPSNAFVISYVGRHNEVKGYSSLLKIGKEILNKDNNIYFLIGGKEEPLQGLKHDHWIEVGWTDKPHDLINASDLFILPNKETYFDLVFLEVLSVGKTMLVSNTGGNKYFKKYKDSGIFYYEYDDIKTCTNKVLDIKKLDLKALDKKNKQIYEENFKMKNFVTKYIEILNKIYKEK